MERIRIAAKYLRVSVPRALNLPTELLDQAYTAAVAQKQAETNYYEIQKRKSVK